MKRDPSIAIALAWLVPGLGHLYMGRPKKALFFFLALTLTYLAGYVLADFRFVRFDDNPFYYVGRWGSGLTWVATWLCGDAGPRGFSPMELYEPGLLYMCSAGLLNVVLVLNILTLKVEEPAKAVAVPPAPLPPAPAVPPRAEA
ncbi:MAG: hypothetical protein K8T20_02785 [Planctomycetes bacterium]|nr:hypothetical protein [Planctomycetota bacterium]